MPLSCNCRGFIFTAPYKFFFFFYFLYHFSIYIATITNILQNVILLAPQNSHFLQRGRSHRREGGVTGPSGPSGPSVPSSATLHALSFFSLLYITMLILRYFSSVVGAQLNSSLQFLFSQPPGVILHCWR